MTQIAGRFVLAPCSSTRRYSTRLGACSHSHTCADHLMNAKLHSKSKRQLDRTLYICFQPNLSSIRSRDLVRSKACFLLSRRTISRSISLWYRLDRNMIDSPTILRQFSHTEKDGGIACSGVAGSCIADCGIRSPSAAGFQHCSRWCGYSSSYLRFL